ncbi:MAG: hypothetical protein HY806_05880 [Nitrospirae bacterium]|nr:hypothetical protein [Nitrospirota bacterium]
MASILYVGCNKSGAPSCTDESVKKLVLEISTTELRDQLSYQTAGRKYEDLKQLNERLASSTLTTKDAETEAMNRRTIVDQQISIVDQQINEAKINLANIRINGKYDDIKKCECGWDLAFSNQSTRIYRDRSKIY